MSKKYLIDEATLTNIASAIRTKTNSTGDIPVTNFANEILNIQDGEDLSAEITAQEEKIAEQDAIIANLMTALEGKAAGGSAKTTKTIYLDWSGDDMRRKCSALYVSNNGFINGSYSAEIQEIEAEGGIVIVLDPEYEDSSYSSTELISSILKSGAMAFYAKQDGGTIYITSSGGQDV